MVSFEFFRWVAWGLIETIIVKEVLYFLFVGVFVYVYYCVFFICFDCYKTVLDTFKWTSVSFFPCFCSSVGIFKKFLIWRFVYPYCSAGTWGAFLWKRVRSINIYGKTWKVAFATRITLPLRYLFARDNPSSYLATYCSFVSETK